MGPIEITVIVLTVIFLVSMIGIYIYKKIKHIPTGDCAACQSKNKKLVKEYKKKYSKK